MPTPLIPQLKDEVNLVECKNFEELQNEIDDYMDYYNNYRYQWKLNRMAPKKYGDTLRSKLNKNGHSIEEQPLFKQFN